MIALSQIKNILGSLLLAFVLPSWVFAAPDSLSRSISPTANKSLLSNSRPPVFSSSSVKNNNSNDSLNSNDSNNSRNKDSNLDRFEIEGILRILNGRIEIGGNSGGGGVANGLAFNQALTSAVDEFIKKFPHLQSLLEKYKIPSLTKEYKVLMVDEPIVVKTKGFSQPSDAAALKEEKTILVTKKNWLAIENEDLRKALALHELFVLAKLEDTGIYTFSGAYFDMLKTKSNATDSPLAVSQYLHLDSLSSSKPDNDRSVKPMDSTSFENTVKSDICSSCISLSPKEKMQCLDQVIQGVKEMKGHINSGSSHSLELNDFQSRLEKIQLTQGISIYRGENQSQALQNFCEQKSSSRNKAPLEIWPRIKSKLVSQVCQANVSFTDTLHYMTYALKELDHERQKFDENTSDGVTLREIRWQLEQAKIQMMSSKYTAKNFCDGQTSTKPWDAFEKELADQICGPERNLFESLSFIDEALMGLGRELTLHSPIGENREDLETLQTRLQTLKHSTLANKTGLKQFCFFWKR